MVGGPDPTRQSLYLSCPYTRPKAWFVQKTDVLPRSLVIAILVFKAAVLVIWAKVEFRKDRIMTLQTATEFKLHFL